MPEMHAIVTGQVARCFRGGNQIVGGDRVLAVRQGDVFDRRALLLVNLQRFANALLDFGVESFAKCSLTTPIFSGLIGWLSVFV